MLPTKHIANWNEETQSETPAIKTLTALGWQFVPAAQLETDREGLKEAILVRRLEKALRKLNPGLLEDNLRKAIRAVTNVPSTGLIDANEKIHRTLVHTLSLEQEKEDGRGKQGRDVHFIDFEHPENNEFLVTQQFPVRRGRDTETARPLLFDVVCFVNGLPLAIIECKSPTLGEKWFEESMKSLGRYQEVNLTNTVGGAVAQGDVTYAHAGIPRAFESVQAIIAAAGSAGARLGTVLTPAFHYGEWREPFPSDDTWNMQDGALIVTRTGSRIERPTPQDILLASALSPRALLDLTANFIAYEAEGGRTVKKIARYQQFIAVNKALRRIRSAPDPTARGGIVWHTQGSGKSLTMLWLAVKLRRMTALENPTIIIVTDRTDLDEQIHKTFQRCGFPNPQRARSGRHLQELLTAGTGLTVMSTIQKFQDAGTGRRAVLTRASNIFALVDEAHRTQYRSLAAKLREALPNACFLGFTGTPIDRKDRSTPRIFGPYIHTYTIQQSVEDGATVPIFYESRLPELRVEGETLDSVFERVFHDLDPKERTAIKNKYATLDAIAGAPKRIERICLDLVEHFERYIAPNGFKAQVVACTRDAAVTYLETLERIGGPPAALIMSGTHNDPKRLAKYHTTKEQKTMLIERFKNKADPLAILVVCDMLLTGFDAPVEQVMYLDSPLKEHALLQAIARVNRIAEGKTYGLVVDYWGISQDLQDALSIFEPRDVQNAMLRKTDELPRLEHRHGQVMRFFANVDRSDLEACLHVLEPEDRRTEFESAFKKFAESMDMVLPDPAALAYQADLQWLGKLRAVARARFRDSDLDLSGYGEKVKKLIEDHILSSGITPLIEPVSIFSKRFDEEIAKLSSKDAQASEMEHAIRHEINVRIAEDPVFYQRLSERLQEIIEESRQRRLESAKTIGELQEIADEMRDVQNRATSLGLSPTGLAIFNLLLAKEEDLPDELRSIYLDIDSEGIEPYLTLSNQIEESLKDLAVIDWTQKDDVQREMRRQVKRHLRSVGYENDYIEALTAKIMDLARARLAK
jgi:type I restriction enzyme R subunit